MSGYREPSALAKTGAAVREQTLSLVRAVGELLLLVVLGLWSVGWLGVAWLSLRQGYVVDPAMVLAFMVVPPLVWYAWRTLGYLPVERPSLAPDLSVPSSS